MTSKEERVKGDLLRVGEPQDLEQTCFGCGSELTRDNITWCEVQGSGCLVVCCRRCCALIDGRETCYMCAGAYESVETDPMKQQVELRRRRSIAAFHLYASLRASDQKLGVLLSTATPSVSRGEPVNSPAANEIAAEAVRAGEQKPMQKFGVYERDCSGASVSGPAGSSGAMPGERRGELRWLPLPLRGRLPGGESSSGSEDSV